MRIVIICFLLLASVGLNAETILHPYTGNPILFSTLKGKWVFINYWASWCEPCLNEISELNQFYDAHQDKVALFAVNYDGVSATKQKKLVSQYQIHYPALAQDPAGALHLEDIRGIPVTFVFSPKGQLVHTLYGAQTAKQLTQLIQ